MALDVQNQQPPLLQLVPPPPPPCGGATACPPVTLNLFNPTLPPPPSNSNIKLLQNISLLPLGSQTFLNPKESESTSNKRKRDKLEDHHHTKKMSRRNGNGPKLELKLNLSPPRRNPHVATPSRSATVSPTSPPSSCLSTELNQDDNNLRYSSSPEATSMVLVGCPRCLMYVMLSEEDPRCPKCKSSVLLDVLHENTTTATKRNSRKS